MKTWSLVLLVIASAVCAHAVRSYNDDDDAMFHSTLSELANKIAETSEILGKEQNAAEAWGDALGAALLEEGETSAPDVVEVMADKVLEKAEMAARGQKVPDEPLAAVAAEPLVMGILMETSSKADNTSQSAPQQQAPAPQQQAPTPQQQAPAPQQQAPAPQQQAPAPQQQAPAPQQQAPAPQQQAPAPQQQAPAPQQQAPAPQQQAPAPQQQAPAPQQQAPAPQQQQQDLTKMVTPMMDISPVIDDSPVVVPPQITYVPQPAAVRVHVFQPPPTPKVVEVQMPPQRAFDNTIAAVLSEKRDLSARLPKEIVAEVKKTEQKDTGNTAPGDFLPNEPIGLLGAIKPLLQEVGAPDLTGVDDIVSIDDAANQKERTAMMARVLRQIGAVVDRLSNRVAEVNIGQDELAARLTRKQNSTEAQEMELRARAARVKKEGEIANLIRDEVRVLTNQMHMQLNSLKSVFSAEIRNHLRDLRGQLRTEFIRAREAENLLKKVASGEISGADLTETLLQRPVQDKERMQIAIGHKINQLFGKAQKIRDQVEHANDKLELLRTQSVNEPAETTLRNELEKIAAEARKKRNSERKVAIAREGKLAKSLAEAAASDLEAQIAPPRPRQAAVSLTGLGEQGAIFGPTSAVKDAMEALGQPSSNTRQLAQMLAESAMADAARQQQQQSKVAVTLPPGIMSRLGGGSASRKVKLGPTLVLDRDAGQQMVSAIDRVLNLTTSDVLGSIGSDAIEQQEKFNQSESVRANAAALAESARLNLFKKDIVDSMAQDTKIRQALIAAEQQASEEALANNALPSNLISSLTDLLTKRAPLSNAVSVEQKRHLLDLILNEVERTFACRSAPDPIVLKPGTATSNPQPDCSRDINAEAIANTIGQLWSAIPKEVTKVMDDGSLQKLTFNATLRAEAQADEAIKKAAAQIKDDRSVEVQAREESRNPQFREFQSLLDKSSEAMLRSRTSKKEALGNTVDDDLRTASAQGELLNAAAEAQIEQSKKLEAESEKEESASKLIENEKVALARGSLQSEEVLKTERDVQGLEMKQQILKKHRQALLRQRIRDAQQEPLV